MSCCYLYRHFDSQGALLYVGICLDAIVRTRAHAAESAWFQNVASITIERFPDRRRAEMAERDAIRSERPQHNKAHSHFEGHSLLGLRIRQLREARNMTQQELANECGVTKSAVCQWERGHSMNIRLVALTELLRVLDISLAQLLGEDA